MNKDRDLMLVFLIVAALVAVSEIEVAIRPALGIVLYASWLLVLMVILKQRPLPEQHRNFFTAVTALPLVRMASILMPIQSIVAKTIVTYYLLLAATLFYIFRMQIQRLPQQGMGKQYLLVIPLALVPLAEWALIQPAKIGGLTPIQLMLLAFACLIQSLYFFGAIQTLAEHAFGRQGITLTAALYASTMAGMLVSGGVPGIILFIASAYVGYALALLTHTIRNPLIASLVLFGITAIEAIMVPLMIF